MALDPSLSLAQQIDQVRQQIHSLTSRRQILSSALLSSSRIQKRLPPTKKSPASTTTTIQSAKNTTLTNIHRLTSTVTTFPFTDPSPPRSTSGFPLRLLGVRIDIPHHDPSETHTGRFGAPYYILLRRYHRRRGGTRYLRIYRHTIPAFVDIRGLESTYLPRPEPAVESEDEDEDEYNEVATQELQGGEKEEEEEDTNQNLHRLVHEVRHALVSWTLRRSSILRLQKELGLPQSIPLAEADGNSENRPSPPSSPVPPQDDHRLGRYGITTLEATAYDCRYVSIKWADGRVGRVEVDNAGQIKQCVVYGKEGRLRMAEKLLTGGSGRIEDLSARLEDLSSGRQSE